MGAGRIISVVLCILSVLIVFWKEIVGTLSTLRYHPGWTDTGGVTDDFLLLSTFFLEQHNPIALNATPIIPFSGLAALELNGLLGCKLITFFHGKQSVGSPQVRGMQLLPRASSIYLKMNMQRNNRHEK